MAQNKSTDVSRRSFIRGQWHSQTEPSQTEVNSSCLNNQGVYCQSCKEVCNEDAIVFDQVQKGIQMPSIITERCTQCHDCMEFCPMGFKYGGDAPDTLDPINRSPFKCTACQACCVINL